MTGQLLVGLEGIRKRWFLYLLLGLILLALGGIAIMQSFAASLASVLILGWLLILSGLTQALLAFWVRQWSGFFLHLLGGVLEIVVGVLVVGAPVSAALGLTLLSRLPARRRPVSHDRALLLVFPACRPSGLHLLFSPALWASAHIGTVVHRNLRWHRSTSSWRIVDCLRRGSAETSERFIQ